MHEVTIFKILLKEVDFMEDIDLVGSYYCTKYDDFVNILSEKYDMSCLGLGNCDECKFAHIVTKMTSKIIIKDGEVIDLE